MSNPHGTPIWYELLTGNREQAIDFYEKVVGWTVGPKPEQGPMDYRMIETGDGAVGGLMELTPDMVSGGAKPGWLFYIGVDDVDASIARIRELGGCVHMGPIDMDGVGRMAMVADPQGVPFYVMRGASDEASTAWSSDEMGKCSWNELVAPDPDAARLFYAEVFGWTYPDKMEMPKGMGDYVFIDAAGQSIGAVMGTGPGQPPGWTFYFRSPDIDAAAANVGERGGTVHAGPMEVPGGDRIIVAADGEGVAFGVVATGK